ncbi:Kinesin-like protein [Forsythia ovata]|uniref:Kinesin-like protein n=1 Tax=Forsythia ovata TaxID=205694 RepID=A0ABD1UD39_9LAMI
MRNSEKSTQISFPKYSEKDSRKEVVMEMDGDSNGSWMEEVESPRLVAPSERVGHAQIWWRSKIVAPSSTSVHLVSNIRKEHTLLCNEVKGLTADCLLGSEAFTALPNLSTLEIKQSFEGIQEVSGLVEAHVCSTEEVWELLKTGSRVRSVESTNAIELSNRSHCLLRVTIVAENLVTRQRTRSHLWLVDLAGSERVGRIEVEGKRMKESQFINKSLSALGDVISALASKVSHIPFRNSKLSHILQSSLGEVLVNYLRRFPYVNGRTKVAACAKHFVGDGGTINGVDEFDTIIDWNGLHNIHMPAYLDSIRKGVATVMVSYSSWNGRKMHANHDLITWYVKRRLKINSFVISGSEGIDWITFPSSCCSCWN